ncbi:MAG TPA: tRNA lysidine(34) synthetase TilS [Steroidobacteraceae bacterium]|nr:tRNA lysidine(34) synthetase TilS [Steroidobacteraceae bacterium]
MSASADSFDPEWLARSLASLLPDYPDVSLSVAFSGGVDSTALLAALARIKRSRLRALHVDHGLRPASGQWAQHCRKVARRLRVPIKVLTTKVVRDPRESLEAAARDARYRVLADELRAGEVLLTAHQRDDQLETVLLQLFRGSGLPGIAAMPAVAPFAAGLLARPLLTRSRAALESWARDQGLTWIDDDSNVDEGLDRNYLRRRVLPLIRERWPAVATAVARSARHAAEAQAILDVLARRDVGRASYGESLSVKSLRALPLDRRRNALRYWITQSGRLAPDTRRLDEIAGPLLNARADANPFVEWGAVRAQRQGDLLSLRSAGSSEWPAMATDIAWSWRSVDSCEVAHLGKLELEPDARGPLDLDALPDTLRVGFRRGGERLSPRSGGPRRALKSLLQEAHVPAADRSRLPLLFAGPAPDAKLLAVADLFLDATVQATPTSRRRGRLLWKKSSP